MRKTVLWGTLTAALVVLPSGFASEAEESLQHEFYGDEHTLNGQEPESYEERLFEKIAEHDRQMLLSGSIPLFSEEEEPHFLIPSKLDPLQAVPLVRRGNGIQACPYARILGLPEELTHSIREFTERSGLMDLFWSHAYGETSPKGKHPGVCEIHALAWPSIFSKEQSPWYSDDYLAGWEEEDAVQLDELNDGREWITITPGHASNWPTSDIHWMDTANEAGYEEMLQVLRDADFDPVVKTIGDLFESSSLTVTAMGFMAITYSNASDIHRDNTGAADKFFQLLIPIVLPENDRATLSIGGRLDYDQEGVAPIHFREHMGILLSGDTLHATPDFDFRPNRGLRVVASIYMANLLHNDVIPIVAGDGTAVFPPKGLEPWFKAQQERHYSTQWNISLANDPGRYLLGDEVGADQWDPDDCALLKKQGKCQKDIYGTRMYCFRTCGVFIDDETYFSELYPDSIPLFSSDETVSGHDTDDITQLSQDELEALLEGDVEPGEDYWWTFQLNAEFDRRALVEAAHSPSASNHLYSVEEEPYFLIPRQLPAFDMIPLVVRDTEKVVCDFARIMSLPEQLSHEITKFAEQSGLMDLFWSHTYGDTSPTHKQQSVCKPDPFWWHNYTNDTNPMSRWLSDAGESGGDLAQLDQLNDGRQWITIVPGKKSNWPFSDIHWMDTANEAGYEEVLHVLQRGGFDTILEKFGKEFQATSWTVTAMGFMAITHSNQSKIHRDNFGATDDFFQMLIPIVLPEEDLATLEIGGIDPEMEDPHVYPVHFRKNTGVLISGDTWHATPTFDFRPNRGLRVVASIYFAQLENHEAINIVAGDGTAVFPPGGMTEWFEAQQGRHWGKGFTLATDPGRAPLGSNNHDTWETKLCQAMARKGRCKTEIWVTRSQCMKTCGVFIDDEVYSSQHFPAVDSEHREDENAATSTTYSAEAMDALTPINAQSIASAGSQ